MVNKNKIINDPVYGFLSIKSKLLYKVIQHPYFQRLRRRKQLGLTEFVYPGAHHTRFHHALKAMHLMSVALDSLKNKGHKISAQEYEAALLAILLHDIGHGPFSHALESTILKGVSHERISLLFMEKLNEEMGGRLDLAIEIFCGRYERPFFHELVSSQLDMDRMDYLQRDCYFTGVIEGQIGVDRIIRMLDLVEERIVVEEKGIYSIENFLNARRLMYWQVYLHKTTVSTEQMLIQLISRARNLASSQQGLVAIPSPHLAYFLLGDYTYADFKSNPEVLNSFALLDDYDIWGAIKFWALSDDFVLRELSKMILERRLLKSELSSEPVQKEVLDVIEEKIAKKFAISPEDAKCFCLSGSITNAAYLANAQHILIKKKTGEIVDIATASDLPNIKAISKIVKKFYLCYPKVISLQDVKISG